MSAVRKFWPLLTGMHRYEKTLSTRGRGHDVLIDAPILAYLIETSHGRILYDVGCDYSKIADPQRRQQYYENPVFPFGPPQMSEEQKLSSRLATLGLQPTDVDLVFLGHLHFDHAGGLCDMRHADIHVHAFELEAARAQADEAYFPDDFHGEYRWNIRDTEYDVAPGIRAIESPGHTAGHMSMWIEMPKGPPILLCGDAADLGENLSDEVAPGLCWQDRTDLAVSSIRKLKRLSEETGAELWPNHDLAFFRKHDCFPKFRE